MCVCVYAPYIADLSFFHGLRAIGVVYYKYIYTLALAVTYRSYIYNIIIFRVNRASSLSYKSSFGKSADKCVRNNFV